MNNEPILKIDPSGNNALVSYGVKIAATAVVIHAVTSFSCNYLLGPFGYEKDYSNEFNAMQWSGFSAIFWTLGKNYKVPVAWWIPVGLELYNCWTSRLEKE